MITEISSDQIIRVALVGNNRGSHLLVLSNKRDKLRARMLFSFDLKEISGSQILMAYPLFYPVQPPAESRGCYKEVV